MPRRLDSGAGDSKPKTKKANTIKKPRTTTTKSTASTKKTKSVPKSIDSAVSGGAKRQTLASLERIEDLDTISPKKGRRKLAFEIDGGGSLAVVGVDCRFRASSPRCPTWSSQKESGRGFKLVKRISSSSKGSFSF